MKIVILMGRAFSRPVGPLHLLAVAMRLAGCRGPPAQKARHQDDNSIPQDKLQAESKGCWRYGPMLFLFIHTPSSRDEAVNFSWLIRLLPIPTILKLNQ